MFFSQNVYKIIFNTQISKRIWGLILLEKDSAKQKSLAHVPIEEL